jgi:hypothetical protein
MPKVDKVEFEKRIRIVQEWILEDQAYTDIVSAIMSKWGLEERQAKKYIAQARERWVNQEQIVVDQKRRLRIEGLKRLKRSIKEAYKGTPRGVEVMLKIDKEISKLEGIYPATKLEVSGKDGQPLIPPPAIDMSKVPKEDLIKIVEAFKKAKVDK